MDLSVWSTLGDMAWKNATSKEQVFLAFCMSFTKVSGELTNSESEYWDVALAAEAEVREYLVVNNIQIVKQDDFELALIADGMLASKQIRTLQAHYGISLCGEVFLEQTRAESERKYQKAIKIAERLAVMGCSSQDNLPYFNASTFLANR